MTVPQDESEVREYIYRQYGEFYDLTTMAPNDAMLLDQLVDATIALTKLNRRRSTILETIADGDDDEDTSYSSKKLAEVSKLISQYLRDIKDIQTSLAIDRKQRSGDEASSVSEYIQTLKQEAKDWLDKRIIRIYCPTCQIMVGRIAPVHRHTHFYASFECSQCFRRITAEREGTEIFTRKEDEWRKAYPVTIVHAGQTNTEQDRVAKEYDDDETIDEGVVIRDADYTPTAKGAEIEFEPSLLPEDDCL